MLDTIRSIIANATTTVDVSSLAGVADGGFREALIAGVREADAAGHRPVVRMVWGHQPAAPFSVRKLRNLHRDLEKAAPNLRIVLALHNNTHGLSGFSWNHSKIVAADGKVAYSSGINMWSDSYLQSTNPVTDVGVVVRGPGAVSAQRFLDVLWTELCTYPTWSVKHSNTLVPENGGANCPSRQAPIATAPVGEVTVLGVGRAGYADTGRVAGTRDPREVSKADRSDSGCKLPPLPNTMNGDPKWDGDNPSDTALRALVESAEKRIVIGQQEAIFSCAVDPSYDVRLFDALARKVVDGIPVTIVVSNEKGAISTFEGYSSDPPSTMAVMRKRVRKLVASDAAATKAICSSLTVARFRYSNADTWPSGNQPALHGKVIAVDDAAFYVGSQNAYPNQLQEFGYIIENPAAMADFKRDYLDPMVQYSSRAALSCDGFPTVPSRWRTGVLDRITPGSDVAVSLGDSFISGEAGRWNGNVGKKGNFGLIDAGADAYWDTATGESEAKCHRSKSAEIHINGITGVNIACSGAITTSKKSLTGAWKPGIDRGVNGTDKYGQLTLLDAVAKHAKVKLVVLSIGGNDMGFSGIILSCVAAFSRPAPITKTCQQDAGVQKKLSDSALAAVGAKVEGAINRIDTTMRNAGYVAGDWKLIVQGYPMPIAADMRYPETYKGRFGTGGCPFYNSDVAWIGTRIPVLNEALRTATRRAAASTGHSVSFMDVEHAFAGRELCSKQAGFVDELPAGPARTASAERVSMMRLGKPFEPAEAIHPNALGQIALQACLQQAWNGGTTRSGNCKAPLDWAQTDADGRPLMRFTAG
jgi:phosphatidylserine/phosphatidylglycerophosphate/cardiolipin synthase-like enzyme